MSSVTARRAILRCDDPLCGGEFSTPIDEDGDLEPDGISRHDDRFHDDGSSWDYVVLRRESVDA